MQPDRFTIEHDRTSGGAYIFNIVENKTGMVYATCYGELTAEICLKALNKQSYEICLKALNKQS